MPAVYFDGIQLHHHHARLVINAMGALNEICTDCGGSMIEVRSVAINSRESPITFHTWCATCGTFRRLDQEFPIEWHRRVLAKVETNLVLANRTSASWDYLQ
ncbi:MAG TPA: hypothetical protein VMC85_23265 [Desulfomonilaceae bacterium]|nr:hypothetical protein [Desulfomonilaceae bacterium]